MLLMQQIGKKKFELASGGLTSKSVFGKSMVRNLIVLFLSWNSANISFVFNFITTKLVGRKALLFHLYLFVITSYSLKLKEFSMISCMERSK